MLPYDVNQPVFYCYHYGWPYDRQIIAVTDRVLYDTFTDWGQVFIINFIDLDVFIPY